MNCCSASRSQVSWYSNIIIQADEAKCIVILNRQLYDVGDGSGVKSVGGWVACELLWKEGNIVEVGDCYNLLPFLIFPKFANFQCKGRRHSIVWPSLLDSGDGHRAGAHSTWRRAVYPSGPLEFIFWLKQRLLCRFKVCHIFWREDTKCKLLALVYGCEMALWSHIKVPSLRA